MHLIRPVGDAQRPCQRIPAERREVVETSEKCRHRCVEGGRGSLHLGQREVPRHACTAVHLHGTVHHLAGHPGCCHFDQCNLRDEKNSADFNVEYFNIPGSFRKLPTWITIIRVGTSSHTRAQHFLRVFTTVCQNQLTCLRAARLPRTSMARAACRVSRRV